MHIPFHYVTLPYLEQHVGEPRALRARARRDVRLGGRPLGDDVPFDEEGVVIVWLCDCVVA